MPSDEGQDNVSSPKQLGGIAKDGKSVYPFGQDAQQNSLLKQLHDEAAVVDEDNLLLEEGSDINAILPTAQGPREKEWAECCQLLLINPEDHKDPKKRSIKMPSSDVRLTPQQYWTSYEMVTCFRRRGMCGGVLASSAGLGKTWMVLGCLILRTLILTNVAEVEEEWASNKSSRHSPRPRRGETAHIPCKCNNYMGIECYADSRSVLRCVIRESDLPNRGPALIQVGPGVIEEWKQALLDCKLRTTYFHPILFHTNVPPVLRAPADLKSQLKTTAEPHDPDRVFTKSHQPNHGELDFEYKPPKNGKQPERFIFLTTYDAKLFAAEFQIPVTLPIEPVPEGNEPQAAVQTSIYGCPIGVHVVDEFHKVLHRDSVPVRLALAHISIRDGGYTDFWSVTATPMPNQLMDIYSTFDILERGWWGPKHTMHGTKELLGLIERHKAANAPGASHRVKYDFEIEIIYFFHRAFILKTDEETEFFGQLTTDIKPVKPELLTYDTPEVFVQDVQKIASGIKAEFSEVHLDPTEAFRSKKAFDKLEVLQVLSTFPGAARLVLDGTIDMTKPALREAIATLTDRRDVSQVALFRECFNSVVRDSPKLSAILESISFMMEDPEVRPKQVVSEADAKKPWFKLNDRQMKKMVILTPSLGEAIFIYMALKKSLPKCRPILFHHDLKSSEKVEILKDWSDLTDRAMHRVFIGPFDLAGTGLNLQAANYQILTGPLRFKSDEVQCFRRTNREGQQLPLVHLIFATEDNPHDRLVLARQAMRSVTSDPFSLSTELELAPGQID